MKVLIEKRNKCQYCDWGWFIKDEYTLGKKCPVCLGTGVVVEKQVVEVDKDLTS